MKIVFLQRYLSPHLTDFVVYLHSCNTPAVSVFKNNVPRDRTLIGWPNYDCQSIFFKESDLSSDFFVNGDIVIVPGLRGFIEFKSSISCARSAGAIFVVSMESLDLRSVKGAIRFATYKVLYHYYSKRIFCFLAIGSRAEKQINSLSNCDKLVINFSYYLWSKKYLTNIEPKIAKKLEIKKLRIGYLGQVIKRKNVLGFLRICERSKFFQKNCEFVIVGSGEYSKFIETYDGNLNIKFESAVSFNERLSMIQTFDCLFLASWFDGWGVTAIEAVALGKFVLVSNGVGVSDDISDLDNVYVFDPCSDFLTDAEQFLNHLRFSPTKRSQDILERLSTFESGRAQVQQLIRYVKQSPN